MGIRSVAARGAMPVCGTVSTLKRVDGLAATVGRQSGGGAVHLPIQPDRRDVVWITRMRHRGRGWRSNLRQRECVCGIPVYKVYLAYRMRVCSMFDAMAFAQWVLDFGQKAGGMEARHTAIFLECGEATVPESHYLHPFTPVGFSSRSQRCFGAFRIAYGRHGACSRLASGPAAIARMAQTSGRALGGSSHA